MTDADEVDWIAVDELAAAVSTSDADGDAGFRAWRLAHESNRRWMTKAILDA